MATGHFPKIDIVLKDTGTPAFHNGNLLGMLQQDADYAKILEALASLQRGMSSMQLTVSSM